MKTQTQEFRGVARAIHTTPEGTHYVYHKTAVVTELANGSIKLDSGGWHTATTKTAMNQAANQAGLRFSVFQRAHEWFVTWRGAELPFEDGMVLQ